MIPFLQDLFYGTQKNGLVCIVQVLTEIVPRSKLLVGHQLNMIVAKRLGIAE